MPCVSGMPIGAATGPESGVRMPSVMVLLVASMPGPVLMAPPPPPLLLAQPASSTPRMAKAEITRAVNADLVAMCYSSCDRLAPCASVRVGAERADRPPPLRSALQGYRQRSIGMSDKRLFRMRSGVAARGQARALDLGVAAGVRAGCRGWLTSFAIALARA